MHYRLFISLLLSLNLCIGRMEAQTVWQHAKPDHERLISKVKESENLSYAYGIKVFDDYLLRNPNDVLVWIEKCKFVDQAQYDAQEEYNPNQEDYDALLHELQTRFPDNIKVQFYLLETMWGNARTTLLTELEEKLEKENNWSDEDKSRILYELAQVNYDSSDFNVAHKHILDAIELHEPYAYSILHAQILIELGEKKEALTVLTDKRDTSTDASKIYQKANLLMLLEKYTLAAAAYDTLNSIDSNYAGNIEVAKAMEAAGYYKRARHYLKQECEKVYHAERAELALFLHDLKFQPGKTALKSYNDYRKKGFHRDPFAIYRLRLFFKHPFLAWRFHDLAGLIVLQILFLAILLIPYIWILPVYVAGQKFPRLRRDVPQHMQWGLKAFWVLSVGYLFAHFTAFCIEPEILKETFRFSYSAYDVSNKLSATADLIFMFTLALFSALMLGRKSLTLFNWGSWGAGKTIGIVIGSYFAYRVGTTLYLMIAGLFTDVSEYHFKKTVEIIANNVLDVKNMMNAFGFGVTFFMAGIFGPIYEEIMFRGVVMQSSQRYIGYPLANVFQALLFATIHGDLMLMPVYFSFGLLCGYMTRSSSSLLPGILFHILNNSIVVLVSKALDK